MMQEQPAGGPPRGKPQRKVRNYLLQPLLQVKLGLYSIIMAIVFAAIFTSVLVLSFQRLFELILELTDLKKEVMDVIYSYLADIAGGLLAIIGIYVLLSVVVSILFTHKLVGPTVAFRRHIKSLSEGKYNSRITLRKADAFNEVAEDLNRLAEVLERKR